jgi:hypothetical protein
VVLPVEEGCLVGLAVALLARRKRLDGDVPFNVDPELGLATVIDDDDVGPVAEVPPIESPA